MATPFEQFINDRLKTYLAAEKSRSPTTRRSGIKRNVEIRRLPIRSNATSRGRPISHRESA
jgi:hypothetical protein